MSDMAHHRRAKGSRVFSDDRLLAYVLGLDDDPELQAAAQTDEHLRRRLDELRADMAIVETRLQGAAPDPGATYADPLAARWSELHEFFQPAPARRRSRWLTVLAPAAAVALALAVGVGVAVHEGTLSGGGSSGGSAGSSVASGAMSAAPQAGQPLPAAGKPSPGWRTSTPQTRELQQQKSQHSLAKQAERFAVVAVARAGAVTGGRQQFTVLRALKGARVAHAHAGRGVAPGQEGRAQRALPRARGHTHAVTLGIAPGVALGHADDHPGRLTRGPQRRARRRLGQRHTLVRERRPHDATPSARTHELPLPRRARRGAAPARGLRRGSPQPAVTGRPRLVLG